MAPRGAEEATSLPPSEGATPGSDGPPLDPLSLRSFDGRVWRSYLEGASLYGVDVAPDGTVWYSDAAGLHTLSEP